MIASARAANVELEQAWAAAWPTALACWSRYTRLRDPKWCSSTVIARKEGLSGSFAMIRFDDQRVVIDLQALRESGLEHFALEILAHEIGHHVYAPGNLSDHVRSLARIRKALAEQAAKAPMIANLYTDLLINDRLTRSAELNMAEVFQRLVNKDGKSSSSLWSVYLRIYEILWTLPKSTLCLTPLADEAEGDARLGARLVRHFSGDWLRGAAPFALLMYPYLIVDQSQNSELNGLLDTAKAGLNGEVYGLTEMDSDEFDAIHPALNPELTGAPIDAAAADADQRSLRSASGQSREPFEYGELLKAAGLKMSPQQIAIQYYRERAAPHLITFPTVEAPRSQEQIPEGLKPWEPGDALDALDWLQSLLISPNPIPGLTTVQREYGYAEGIRPKPEPLDLDLYVDSSGSMPDPTKTLSYPALAGAVIALSALRVGGKVQVTLWSGKNQLLTTPGFVRDENAVLAVLTGYIGGGTQFPLPTLRDGVASRSKLDRAAHILVVSDDGASTMFESPDERGVSGFEVCKTALANARGGGTLVLQISKDWAKYEYSAYQALRRARDEFGWAIEAVTDLAELMQFARSFVQQNYGAKAQRQTRQRANV